MLRPDGDILLRGRIRTDLSHCGSPYGKLERAVPKETSADSLHLFRERTEGFTESIILCPKIPNCPRQGLVRNLVERKLRGCPYYRRKSTTDHLFRVFSDDFAESEIVGGVAAQR